MGLGARLGVIPQDANLTPWPDDLLKRWDQLTADEKKQADVFAAYWAYTDHEIGRVIQHVEDMGKLDNTLIIYIAGDNGNSAEGTPIGTPNEVASFNGIDIPIKETEVSDCSETGVLPRKNVCSERRCRAESQRRVLDCGGDQPRALT